MQPTEQAVGIKVGRHKAPEERKKRHDTDSVPTTTDTASRRTLLSSDGIGILSK